MWKYEIKVFQGFVRFLTSPVQNWRKLRTSYFCGSYLSGILVVLGFFLVAEPAALHLLVGQFLSPAWSQFFHIILLVLELWAVEQILGHLYWIAHSKVEVSDRLVTLELGLVRQIRFDPAFIERMESSHFERTEPRMPRFALDRDINLRIHFTCGMPACRMGKTRFMQALEVSLREKELEFFKSIESVT